MFCTVIFLRKETCDEGLSYVQGTVYSANMVFTRQTTLGSVLQNPQVSQHIKWQYFCTTNTEVNNTWQ